MVVVDSMAAQVGNTLVEVEEVDKVLDADTCEVCMGAIWAQWAAQGQESQAPGTAGTPGNICTEDTACTARAADSMADSMAAAADTSVCKAPYHRAKLLGKLGKNCKRTCSKIMCNFITLNLLFFVLL